MPTLLTCVDLANELKIPFAKMDALLICFSVWVNSAASKYHGSVHACFAAVVHVLWNSSATFEAAVLSKSVPQSFEFAL